MSDKKLKKADELSADDYRAVLLEVVELLEQARRTTARTVNSIMTATYWEIGRRIVQFEQGGEGRAQYGKELLKRLSVDLTERFGRGFGAVNLSYMRRFFLRWPPEQIFQTLSEKSAAINFQTASEELPTPSKGTIRQATSGEFEIAQTSSAHWQIPEVQELIAFSDLAARFPLPWSHYVKLLSVEDTEARRFYEDEALRGGWSVRQLDRQVSSKFYQRTLLSKNKAEMLEQGAKPKETDFVAPEQEIKDPFVLEFLDLKDEYSESDLETALIEKLEDFLLELGGDFTFVGRQRRLRIGNEWYRIDLLFFHRRLRCLVVIDLKLGKFTHADSGQMHMYLNYAAEHWTHEDENPPVGLILCAEKDEAVAHYSLDGLPNKVMAAEYKIALPDEKLLAAELEQAKRKIEQRKANIHATEGEGQ